METYVKLCPNCKTTATLQAPCCHRCGHAYRTKFDPTTGHVMSDAAPSVAPLEDPDHRSEAVSHQGLIKEDRLAAWSARWRERDWEGIARQARQSGSYSLGSIFHFLPSAPPYPGFWRLFVRGTVPL